MNNNFLKSHMIHLIIILLVIIVGGYFFGKASLFSFLAILICPIMMIFMMKGHDHK